MILASYNEEYLYKKKKQHHSFQNRETLSWKKKKKKWKGRKAISDSQHYTGCDCQLKARNEKHKY